MRVVVKFLVERDGRYYFRRRVPDELREVIGKREWKVALGNQLIEQVELIRRVRALTRDTDAQIRRAAGQTDGGLKELELADQAFDWASRNGFLRGGAGLQSPGEGTDSEYGHWLERVLETALARSRKQSEDELEPEDFDPQDWLKIQTAQRGERIKTPMTVGMAARSYAKRYKGGELAKAEAVAVEQFIAFAGDRALDTVRRADVADWINYLQQDRQNKPSTVRRRVNSLRAVVNRAIEDFDLDIKNPFNRPRLEASAAGSQEDRLPFHAIHFDLIEHHLATGRVQEETRLLLCLLSETGCRPMEIAGLDWLDVKLDHEVPHLMIRRNTHRGLKTQNAERDIPLVGDTVQTLLRRKLGVASGPVFSDSARDTGALSQRLNKVIRAAGVPRSPRLVVYSFRHAFEQALRDSGASATVQRYLLGHAEQSITDRYGAPRPSLALLRSATPASKAEIAAAAIKAAFVARLGVEPTISITQHTTSSSGALENA